MEQIKNQYVIQGGQPLNGTITSSGAKNAALKMIAAAVLTTEDVVINNVPKINDVLAILEIINSMGGNITWEQENRLRINCASLDPEKIDQKKVGNLRGSVVLIGPLLARFKKIRIHEPGGCRIGARPITTTIHALESLGANVSKDGKFYIFETEKLIGSRIILDEVSVTTTETLLMAACLAQGQTEIHLCATEPEIGNLIDQLITMGAKITGKDTHSLKITGSEKLNGGESTVIPDRVEIGTYAIAIAATRGQGTIKQVIPNHMDNLLNKFDRIGIKYEFGTDPFIDGYAMNTLTVLSSSAPYKSIHLDTRPYPGFSTDLQSPMVVLLTQAEGKSQVFETQYMGRLEYTKILVNMGANIDILDQRTVIVNGTTKLNSQNIDSPDLRAGAAFVIAGLIAQGTTNVYQAQIIDRGYENFDEKLRQLGAQIERV